MKYTLYIVFVISATLILLNRFTAFYINDYRLHFILLLAAASTFIIIAGQLIFKKLTTARSIMTTIVFVGLLCFLKAYFTWGGDWKTEKVLYQNLNDTKNTIDRQLRGDRFAFGYKKRIVEINRLAPGMVWTKSVDTLTIDHEKWQRVE